VGNGMKVRGRERGTGVTAWQCRGADLDRSDRRVDVAGEEKGIFLGWS
jgi:hypothetical protein